MLLESAFYKYSPFIARLLKLGVSTLETWLLTWVGYHILTASNIAREHRTIETYHAVVTATLIQTIIMNLSGCLDTCVYGTICRSAEEISLAETRARFQPYWNRIISPDSRIITAYCEWKYDVMIATFVLASQISRTSIIDHAAIIVIAIISTCLAAFALKLTRILDRKSEAMFDNADAVVRRAMCYEEWPREAKREVFLKHAKGALWSVLSHGVFGTNSVIRDVVIECAIMYTMNAKFNPICTLDEYDDVMKVRVSSQILIGRACLLVNCIYKSMRLINHADARIFLHLCRGRAYPLQHFTQVTIDKLEYHIESLPRRFDLSVNSQHSIAFTSNAITLMKDPSGFGKSTLAGFLRDDVDHDGIRACIMTLWNGDTPFATINGADAVMSLSKYCAYLEQDETPQYSGVTTIRRLFSDNVKDEQIINILQRFRLEQFTSVNQKIGGDHRVSPGQWTRIRLAQILLNAISKPSTRIIILDELDKNIDADAITRIIEYLREIAHDKIIIVISHHPVTHEMLRDSPRIVFDRVGDRSVARMYE